MPAKQAFTIQYKQSPYNENQPIYHTEDILDAIKTVSNDMPRIMYLVPSWPFAFIPSAPNSVINKVVAPARIGKM